VKLGPLIRLLPAVALAAAVVCALEALSDAAAGADAGGEPPTGPAGPPGAPDAAVAPAPVPLPDGGASRADRHRARRFRRLGGFPGQVVDGGAPVDAARPGSLRDAGVIPMAVPRPPPPPIVTPPPPPPPPPTPTGPSALPVTPDQPFNTCQKIPSGKRSVKANLKPEVELPELVAWISSVTCKAFVLPGHLSQGKKVTFIAQGMMTPQEAYAAFLTALDANGLTVEKGPGFYKIIEASKAKAAAVPVYDFDGRPTQVPPKPGKRPAN